MDDIFTVHNGMVQLTPEGEVVPEFKLIRELYKKDAPAYFNYIYFVTKYNSPYSSYSDSVREDKCRKDFLGKLDVTPEIKMAIRKYNEFQETVNIRLLQAARSGCEKLIEFCNSVDLNEKDRQGKLVHKVNDLATTLQKVAGIRQSIDQLEESVRRDVLQGKTKGGKYISQREE